MTGHATHTRAAKRQYTPSPRVAIPMEQTMGRTEGRDDRKRWHILVDRAPVCGRIDASAIVFTAPYEDVQSRRICTHCHIRFSWTPMPQDYTVEDRGYLTPCWIWTRGPYHHVYGKRNHQNVHREAYEAEHGAIPDGHIIHHLCFETQCINPDHLEAMSRADHLREHRIWRNSSRSQKGRPRG